MYIFSGIPNTVAACLILGTSEDIFVVIGAFIASIFLDQGSIVNEDLVQSNARRFSMEGAIIEGDIGGGLVVAPWVDGGRRLMTTGISTPWNPWKEAGIWASLCLLAYELIGIRVCLIFQDIDLDGHMNQYTGPGPSQASSGPIFLQSGAHLNAQLQGTLSFLEIEDI
ncbi:hypothetical protein ACJX0J_023800 [Zea mays]